MAAEAGLCMLVRLYIIAPTAMSVMWSYAMQSLGGLAVAQPAAVRRAVSMREPGSWSGPGLVPQRPGNAEKT